MSEPGVDAEEVRRVAALARVELDESQIERFQAEFADILEYFDRLADVPDHAEDIETEGALRRDSVEPSLDRAAAMENASEREDDYFKGPPVG